MTVVQRGPLPSSNFLIGRQGRAVDKIVLHTTVGWISGADARFHNPAAEVSAHFGVRVDSELWQWVQTWDSAFHAGNFEVNLSSIGIEHEDGGDFGGVRPLELYDRSVRLVAQLCKENSIPCARGSGGPGVYDHRQINPLFGGSATACPDALDTDRIIREAAALLTPASVPVVVVPASVDLAVLRPLAPVVDVLHEWVRIYKQECPLAGIRADIALAQALHETGFFTFTHLAQPDWNNPAGLGVTGTVGTGNRFTTRRAGVIAHLQHLLMYFTSAHTDYCTPLVDQRHYAHRGYPNDVNQLTGHWAVPGVNPVTGATYAGAILGLVPQAKALLDSV